MIIATAGHIDHGKTTLVKALTGVDTDRLPAEKARGISIDLGFAYSHVPDCGTLGFVDVPGHERFVRNMLAGVCGIDYAMLVVAADDGVMPQTVEHLHIVDLLAVPRGIAVITKTDRVSPERVREVMDEVRRLLAPTVLRDCEILAVSALGGEGMAGLRERLAGAVRAHQTRRSEGRHFRYAVDRAFGISGSGTVVTGTVFDGTVTVGERLVVSPGGAEARVRGIQKDGQSVRHAGAGERCGLNLAGVALEQVGRGDWVLAPGMHAPTRRLDVQLKLLEAEAGVLKHWTALHLHLGTMQVLARVSILRGGSIAPGETAVAQLILEEPIVAANGDRFIIRDQSARRTLGGGTVLDPYAPKRRVDKALRAAQLSALAARDPAQALRGLLEAAAGGVDIDWFQRVFNLASDRLDSLLRDAAAHVFGKAPQLAFAPSVIQVLGDAMTAALQRMHRDDPHFLGIEAARLGAMCAPALNEAVLTAVLRFFVREKRIELNGTLVSLPARREAVASADEAMWQKVKPVFEAAGFKLPKVEDVASAANLKPAVVEDLLYRKLRSGEVFLVAPGRFCPRTTLARLAALARDVAQEEPGHEFTAARFRDRSGVNRLQAIEILECLDRLGITLRRGNTRIIRKDFAAEPAQAVASAATE